MPEANLNLPTDLPDWIEKEIDPNVKDLTKYFLQDIYEVIQYSQKNNFLDSKGFLDIKKLIEENDNLILSFEDLQDNDGSIEYLEKENKFLIKINKNRPETRQRFIMAHEYIHYILHRNTIIENSHTDKIQLRGQSKDELDSEANFLAAEILMSTECFKKAWKNTNGNSDLVKQIFNVSQQAVIFRANHLGLK